MASGKIIEPFNPGDEGATRDQPRPLQDHEDSQFSPVIRRMLPGLARREDTVKKHVTHVLGKLGAANRTEAVTRARQLGLIS